MKKAIITGFERFGDYAMNPTERLAREIDGKIISGHKIHALVLPVGPLVGDNAVDYGRRILLAAERIDASVIISLGISSQVKGVRIEGRCSNWVENEKYCGPEENRQPLVGIDFSKMERTVRFGRWLMPEMHIAFAKADIPCEGAISQDPGTYCVNALMYHVLRRMLQSALGQIPFFMAHVPCTKEAVKGMPDFKGMLITQEQLKKTVAIILKSYV